jgi:hypothetical protein
MYLDIIAKMVLTADDTDDTDDTDDGEERPIASSDLIFKSASSVVNQ